MSITIDNLHHVGVIVSNMERSVSFYSKLLGTGPKIDTQASGPALAAQTEIPGAQMRIVFFPLSNGGTGLELIEFVNAKGNQAITKQNTIGSVHFAFKVSDAKKVYDQLSNDGYDFIAPAQHMADDNYGKMKGHTFGYFRGPDNELIEILEVPSLLDKIMG